MFRFLTTVLALVIVAVPAFTTDSFDEYVSDETGLFSLTYGGIDFEGAFDSWVLKREDIELKTGVRQHTSRWLDPETSLETRLEVMQFADFQATEWVPHLTNIGTTDSPIIEKIKVADFQWDCVASAPVILQYAMASHALITDFQPRSTPPNTGAAAAFTPFGDRSSDGALP